MMQPLGLQLGEFGQTLIAGAPLVAWLKAIGIWAVLSVIFIVVQRVLARRLEALAKRTRTNIDNVIANALRRTRAYFLVGLAFYASVALVQLPQPVVRWGGRIAFVLLLLQVIRWGNGLITFYVERYRKQKLEEDPAAVMSMQALGFIGRLVLWTLVLLVALDNFGVDITALVASVGIAGVAIGLAVQNILGDLFASLSIVLDKPFVVGDFIIVDNYMGTVEHIGLKSTRIRSLTGEQLVFSNSDLLNSRIRNYKRMRERRIVFTVGVVYQTPKEKLEKIPEIIREVVEAQERVRFDRAHFKEFGPSSLNFEVVYWVLDPDYTLYMNIQQAINLAIFERFAQEGIEFAYPTQTLYVYPMKPVEASASPDADRQAQA
ncbi:mechanosensitive ion channel family protein [Rhodothermus profundi]|uniref:Small-conductance mechanosensitive channel n=1 Tax=Rhodothermus profundi TaxID=633813 RepID=A0A1M6WTR6_9BACT|nr:mechanosensitive ion channel family protein [Rhodothermus profundi]SHK97034.1 Small-conductance mechanosensitive channel [Rhodothermus profundi]